MENEALHEPQRNYVLHEPKLNKLQGTANDFGHLFDKNRRERVQNEVNERQTARNRRTRRKSARIRIGPRDLPPINYCPQYLPGGVCREVRRDYVLHEPPHRYVKYVKDNYFYQLRKTQQKVLLDLYNELEFKEEMRRKMNKPVKSCVRVSALPKIKYCPQVLKDGTCREIRREYVLHEPLHRYVKNVKENYLKQLKRQQKKKLLELFQKLELKELKKRENEMKNEKMPEKKVEEDILDGEIAARVKNPQRHVLHEPPFRYYEAFWTQYKHLLPKERKEAVHAKFKESRAKRKPKKGEKKSKVKKAKKGTGTASAYHGPAFRRVKGTFEDYQQYFDEERRSRFKDLYEALKAEAEKRQEIHQANHVLSDGKPPPEVERFNIKFERDYRPHDPKFNILNDTINNFKPYLNSKYIKSIEENYNTLKERDEKRAKTREEWFRLYVKSRKEKLEKLGIKVKEPEVVEQKPKLKFTDIPEQQRCMLLQEREAHREKLGAPPVRTLQQNFTMFKDQMSDERKQNINLHIARTACVPIEQIQEEINRRRQKKVPHGDKEKIVGRLATKKQKEAKKKVLLDLYQKLSHLVKTTDPKLCILDENQQKIYAMAYHQLVKVNGQPLCKTTHASYSRLALQVTEFVSKTMNL